VATSFESFEPWVKDAAAMAAAAKQRQREGKPQPGDAMLIEEAESLTFWAEGKLSKLDPKLRASIAAGLNGACSLFDVPEVRRSFAPTPADMAGKRAFIGFREALERGLVVAVRIPGTQFKTVSIMVRTLLKLNFFDAVLERLTHLKPGERPRQRGRGCAQPSAQRGSERRQQLPSAARATLHGARRRRGLGP
jgi:hypothetical protein